MLFDISNAGIEMLPDDQFQQKQVAVSVLRLDKIHPVVSGNKLFKLHYFLQEALLSSHKTILTFGGAWSNHLAATAYACSFLGLKSIGIVRGEEPAELSHTLQQCLNDGMQLKFISRQQYAQNDNAEFIQSLKNEFGEWILVPEGGYHPLGAKGAALIMELTSKNYSHICTAMGTATTLAGLLMAAEPFQKIIGIPVLKGMTDMEQRLQYLTGYKTLPGNFELLDDYHFGGYAKKTGELIQFMNQCWQQYQLPLDFVYTAKMFYAVTDQVKKDHFPKGSNILCLHTGGLQGNRSLPANTLNF
ncbi:MAG: pyridoxal-phosphate dependent enzyme [Chitinophagaceae bacterium]|nr:pyridoxal-phosphate dependent enzyme [Chitinophagaceae bacterium]